MKIIIARTAGFCMGVRRAVDLAVDITSKKQEDIYTIGPLIHNNQTLDMLRERGVKIFSKEKALPEKSTVMIRAHGVPLETERELAIQGFTIVDGTCPKVKTVHKVIEKQRESGFAIIITGDKDHAEVIGLLSYAKDAGYLIQSVEDIDKLPDFKKICLVSQTTFSMEKFDKIRDKFYQRYRNSEIIIKKTICSTTEKRQKEATELSKSVDLMIVVGGKNSANTLRLAQIAKETQTPTFHIETEKEIQWEDVCRCKRIGITAGASTPLWMIKRVTDHIHHLTRINKKGFSSKFEKFFEILANVNIFVAAGGVAMYYASSILQELPFTVTGAVLSFLYLMSVYLWNSLANVEKSKHLDISRYRFYNAKKKKLSILTLSCIAILLTVSMIQNISLFYLMLLLTVAGCVYHFTIVPKPFRKYVKYSNLENIPTSRDLFAALAWAILITLIPHAIYSTFLFTPATVAIFLWTFFLAYLRSLIFDLRDIEGDRIMGRETLVTVIGEKKAKGLIFSTLFTSLIILLCTFLVVLVPEYGISRILSYTSLLQIPVLIYLWFFMKWQYKMQCSLSPLFNFLTDGIFYIAAAGVWIASVIVG